jgi:phosphatidylglycerophosphatase A
MRKNWALAIATWGGLGYFPKGQGTVASVAAIVISYAAMQMFGVSPIWWGVAALCLFFPAIRASDVAASHLGRHDPPQVVVDEVVGQWMTVAAVAADSWQSWLAALVLFRVFDIAKPWPIRKFEALPGGLGVVADDAVAGLCAIIVMLGLQYFSVWS